MDFFEDDKISFNYTLVKKKEAGGWETERLSEQNDTSCPTLQPTVLWILSSTSGFSYCFFYR